MLLSHSLPPLVAVWLSGELCRGVLSKSGFFTARKGLEHHQRGLGTDLTP